MRWISVKVSIAILASVFFLPGCAGTAGGNKDSSIRFEEDHVLDLAGLDSSSALIVIRYPAMIDASAKEEYVRAYSSKVIGEELSLYKRFDPNIEKLADLMLAKSNYYAMSIYDALIAELPEDRVLLSPHVIYSQGGLKSKPLLATETTPTVLTFDFFTYSHPDLEKMMDDEPLTFGDLVTPVGVLSTNHWGRPETHGLLLSSGPLLDSAWLRARSDLKQILVGRILQEKIEYDPTHSFVYFLNSTSREEPSPPKGSLSQAVYSNSVAVFPVERILLNSDEMDRLARSDIDPFQKVFSKNFAERVTRILNEIDDDKAVYLDKFATLERFDQEVASAYLSRNISPSVRSRLKRAESLLSAERKFFAKQSKAIFNGVYTGEYGQQMRQIQYAEYAALEQRRALARQQNWNTAMQIVSTAAAVYGMSRTSSSDYDYQTSRQMQQNNRNLINHALQLSMNNFELELQSNALGENFLVSMAPAIEEQILVNVDLLEGTEQIRAASYEEFENKLMRIYQRSVRGIYSAAAEVCEFKSPDFTVSGVWYGSCVNGVAEGRGYGSIMEKDTGAVRYVGEAKAGLVDGEGFLVVFDETYRGGVTYEGSFRDGFPHGPIRLNVPGNAPQFRNFKKGKDSGSFSQEAWTSVYF